MAAVVTACGQPVATSPGPATTAASPTSAPPATDAAATSASSPSGSVAVDESLLGILPDTVDGIEIVSDPTTATTVSRDPALAGDVEALAIGLAVDAADAGANLAIVNVVRLTPGVMSDAFFRNWRDSFDEAACAQAGGMAGNAEAELDGRTVYIGSCAGGAHTYHVAHSDDVVVSVTSVGERRLGEQIVSNLDD